MVWGCFSCFGTCFGTCGPVLLKNRRVDAVKYLGFLENYLLPWASLRQGESWMFQKDNTAIQTARIVRKYLYEKIVYAMPWPTRSPDLNHVEN